ncbi:chemokine-like protein TAFA-5 isoform X2 [Salmo trutta]|uniref:chemokine-like protein TAFA-5 isoform X2 n=1 Tax=Salmo trutta TaxID=8032 RepID=UPI00112FFCE5|nr:chemokine-like protein TAFA-5 isoform X2 [Salmo trutta]
MQLLRLAWALTGAAVCCFVILLIHSHVLKEGQLAAGTCEIVTLDRDSSQPRRTIARQTARCACKKGQIAGTTRARPACVDALIVRSRQWCEMTPCLDDEGCDLLVNHSGWTCTQPGGRVKTTTIHGGSSVACPLNLKNNRSHLVRCPCRANVAVCGWSWKSFY